ncbi:DNA repair REX1-B-domain-containing protein [Fimicolochytrium jonesii]|uniref:DNA repair REX1-B-domain-containing protein n=1 Tax=Fimicolochytrium jonesii TaxID=1396493 RepID=UPI0022FE19EB|nr:DNA repair REX1-B-domain-containing protein [Fimicolochytrium jonesii]KAI8815964.1 DNA repair REX1-B-domain-containing protein [Fimicolochytrium jonesii]
MLAGQELQHRTETATSSLGDEKMPVTSSPRTPFDCLHECNLLQSKRVQTYKEFERGFQQYVTRQSTSEEYQTLAQTITASFSSLSQKIKAQESALRDLGRDDLAKLVLNLQSWERAKLEKTAMYQIRKSETDLGVQDYAEEVAELIAELGEIGEQINDAWDEIRSEMAELA